MAKLFRNTPGTEEGKFLVLRRDGTVPNWPHFVLGAADPNTPAALRAYADEAEKRHYDPDFVADVRELAVQFEGWRAENHTGDPDAGPHRKDLPAIVAMMRLGKGA